MSTRMVLGLDLAKVTMPEAIAAMVEAWLDAQEIEEQSHYTIEDLQKLLNRSRASVYRILNTGKDELNPPFDASKLNCEHRVDVQDPVRVSAKEVDRWIDHKSQSKQPAERSAPPEQGGKLGDQGSAVIGDSESVSAQSFTYQDRIVASLSQMVQAGLLRNGDKMPSLRDVSNRVGCHRNTALKVFQALEKDGAITAWPGSGYYIADSSRITACQHSQP